MKMSSSTSQFHWGNSSGNGVFPVSAFSAFHLLRNYNYLLSPPPTDVHKHIRSTHFIPECSLQSPEEISSLDNEKSYLGISQGNILAAPSSLLKYSHPVQFHQSDLINGNPNVISPCGSLLNQNCRRQRGEKKPIPDEQKDDKYYERRRRNNQAAKKSRDARKLREDQIALRATILEHENAILKAQVLTLREEASSLRQMLLQKKTLELTANPIV